MSTRTDWGYFKPVTTLEPEAVGDAHAQWKCPNKKWVYPEDDGSDSPPEPYQPPCPFKSVAQKRDECSKCGVVFIYP